MRQYDVFAIRTGSTNRPYLMVLQHDAISDTETIVVAPCVAEMRGPIVKRTIPKVMIGGEPYRVLVQEISAISRRSLTGAAVANLAAHRDEFTAAIDLLFTGD